MSSVIAICNLALSNVGKDNINSIDEAGAEARACRQFYVHTRDLLLQGYPWGFAGKTQSLAATENLKLGKWAYAYQRPTDCLKVRSLRAAYSEADMIDPANTDSSAWHEIEGSLLYTNISPAYLRYTFTVTDPSRFPPMFQEALAWHLSVRLAMPLTRDPKVRADAYQMAAMTTAQAQMLDANEERHTSDIVSELVEVRRCR